MRYFLLVAVLVLGISAPAFSAGKCRVGRLCTWETKYATYAGTILDYNLFMYMLAKGTRQKNRTERGFLKQLFSSGRVGEADENQQDIYLLSGELWDPKMTFYGPMCKFRFKGKREIWWANIASIKCP